MDTKKWQPSISYLRFKINSLKLQHSYLFCDLLNSVQGVLVEIVIFDRPLISICLYRMGDY